MKALMLVFVSFISISIATSTFAKEQIIAADLWFPGDVGSEWLYSVEHDVFHSTEKIVDPKMLDNKEYVIVKETGYVLMGRIEKFLLDKKVKFSPFLTFRRDIENNRILGYGTEMNQVYTDVIKDTYQKAGFPKENTQVRFLSDEWIMLENPAWIGGVWTVMECKIETLSLDGKVEVERTDIMKAKIVKMEPVGRFPEAIVVRYDWSLEGEWQEQEKEDEGFWQREHICTIWLAPNVGMVKSDIVFRHSDLSEHNIIPIMLPKAVSSANRLVTTWGTLKQAP